MSTASPNDKYLSHLQAKALDLAASFYDDYFKALDQKIMDLADGAKTNDQQWNLFSLSRDLKAQKTALCRRYDECLIDGFIQFKLGRLGGKGNDKDELSLDLSIVANEELERSIAVSSVARRAETRNSEQLFALNQRMAMLNGGKKIPEDGNPIGPYQYANALACMIEPLKLDNARLAFFCRAFEQLLNAKLGDFYTAMNNYLIAQGILPNLRYGISRSASSTSHTPVRNDDEPKGTHGQTTLQMQQGQQSASAGGYANNAGFANNGAYGSQGNSGDYANQGAFAPPANQGAYAPSANQQQAGAQSSGSAAPAANTAAAVEAAHQQSNCRVVQPHELVQVLQQVERQQICIETFDADSLPAMTVAQYQQFNQQVRAQFSDDQAISANESKTIDLVGLVFEYMLSDELLPDSVKAVLSYLHTPFLKVALLDPGLFEQNEHPARQLLNLLADAGHKWVSSEGASQFKIFPKIKSIVRRVLLEVGDDVDVLHELLAEMQEFNNKVARKVEVLEQRARAKVEGEEKIRAVKQRVYGELKKRLDQHPVPAAMVVLILHPWADFMIFTLLRFGDSSEQWRSSLGVVDDIFWSLAPKSSENDKIKQQRLMKKLPTIIKQSITEISFDSNKATKLIDILHSLQLKTLANETVKPVAAAELKEIEEDIHLEDYVITDVSAYTQEEQQMLGELKHVEFGSWLEFGGEKKKQRSKIAWFNPKTEHYMLVDTSGSQVVMRSAIEVARLLLTENARIVKANNKPFFERALESVIAHMKGATKVA